MSVGSTILAARLVIFVTFLDLFIQFPVVAPFARGLGATPSAAGALFGMAVFGFGFGLLFPPVTALVVEATDRSERGAAFGVFYAVYSFGVVVGSVLSGALDEWGGPATAAPFLVGATVALAAALAVLAVGRRFVPAASRQPSL